MTPLKSATFVLITGASLMLSISTSAQESRRIAAGEAAWDKAGCLQCHGASGEGGTGGEFPAGPSLRPTLLDRAELVETKAISNDAEETNTMVMLPNINGGLAPTLKTHELRNRRADGTTESEKTTLLADGAPESGN